MPMPSPRVNRSMRRARTLLSVLRGRRPSGDSGVAMILVLGTALVLTGLVVATLAFTVNGVRSARGDQDWQAALPAAEAGVDHYLSRLNEDGTYWEYGNPAAPFSASSAALLTLPTGASANPAFDGWTDVPGSEGRAQFRYAVDTTAFFTSGIIKLQSTGRVGDRTRTVESSIGRRNFIDYLYFTDFEVKDPALYSTAAGDSYDPAGALVECNRHLYDATPGYVRRDRVNSDVPAASANPGCSNINFVGEGGTPYFAGDTLNGPFHSNDAVYVCRNPTITAEATTSYDGSLTEGRHYVRNTGCSTTGTPQIAASGNDFTYAPPLELPPTNGALANQVDPTYTDGETPGCLYTGPTEIRFNDDETMDVTSPWSKPGGPADCGTGPGRALPDRGVIWVRNVPSAPDADSRDSPTLASGATCTSTSNPLGYPKRYNAYGYILRDVTPYGCRSGDAIVSGRVKGQVTVGAENNIVIANDLTYADSGCTSSGSTCTDIIGLIANNFVETMHPVWCNSSGTCYNLTSAQDDLVVEAAILSVQHSFRVQNYQVAQPLGMLTVRGAIGQKFRGAVGSTNGPGYSKNYNYDWRLRYASPPYFIDPVESAFGQKTWSEPRAAYPADAP